MIIIATSSGLARYGPVLFAVHTVQHLLLMMVAPILLVLAGPVTLALRALPPSTDSRWPGPREWLQSALHSRISRALTHPVVALALYVASLYVLYFTGPYELAVRSHAAHLAMIVHFLGVVPTPLQDQRNAGGIAWSFGELPTVIVLGALMVQWIHADERQARRRDRAADRAEAEGREDDELAAYNRMLAGLAKRDRQVPR